MALSLLEIDWFLDMGQQVHVAQEDEDQFTIFADHNREIALAASHDEQHAELIAQALREFRVNHATHQT